MATTLPKATPPGTKRADSSTRQASGNQVGKLLLLIILVGLFSAVVFGSGQYLQRFSAEKATSVLTHTVEPGELLVTVTEDGNVESASNIDIKCQVAGGSSILWIVDDGATVSQGDKLVELDSAAIDEQINQQRITYEKARSAKIQAEKNFEVAKLAVQEFLEGTFKQQKQDAEATITIAMENLRSAQNSVEHAQRMFRKGYVSSLELEGQRFAVERAQLELDSARTAMDVLVNFTRVKTLQDLESQRDTAEAQMKSETAAFDLEEARLKRLEAQMAQCTIIAPQDGMVVYANESGGRFGQQQATIEEGATVRERQTILRLPDLSKMQVKVNVHESKVEQVRPGMRARIRILDRVMTGVVTSIANQPEPTGWFSANVKEYATLVRIDGQPDGLRPGMTAEVEILIAHLKDASLLPVASVVEQGRQFYAWSVGSNGEYEKRTLLLGASNDQFVEVKDGVSPGDTVLLNPRAVVADARAMAEATPSEDSGAGRFGDSGDASPGSGGPRAGGPGGGGPGGGGPGMGGPGAGAGGPGAGGPGAGGPGAGGPGAGAGGPGAGGPGAGGPGGGRGNLMRLDTDGDGKISREEAPEQMKSRFDTLDANGDGFLDQSDFEAMRSRQPE